jgi:hypothetical protein
MVSGLGIFRCCGYHFFQPLYSNRGVVTGDRSSDMSFWISRIKRRITIHLASCHTCNEGCGGWIRARRDSATTRFVQTWWGPYENFSAAYRAAKRQVTTTNRAVVRACRHCKPNPASAYMVNAVNSPKYLTRSSHTDISFWVNVGSECQHVRVHVGSCGVITQHMRSGNFNPVTDFDTISQESGWIGPFESISEARTKANQIGSLVGVRVFDCLRCARSRLLERPAIRTTV